MNCHRLLNEWFFVWTHSQHSCLRSKYNAVGIHKVLDPTDSDSIYNRASTNYQRIVKLWRRSRIPYENLHACVRKIPTLDLTLEPQKQSKFDKSYWWKTLIHATHFRTRPLGHFILNIWVFRASVTVTLTAFGCFLIGNVSVLCFQNVSHNLVLSSVGFGQP